jgi:hypothetical protein
MKVWNERLAIEIGGTFADSKLLDQSSGGLCRLHLKFRPLFGNRIRGFRDGFYFQ